MKKLNKAGATVRVIGFAILTACSAGVAQAQSYTNIEWGELGTAIRQSANNTTQYGMWVFISLAAIGVGILFYRKFVRR